MLALVLALLAAPAEPAVGPPPPCRDIPAISRADRRRLADIERRIRANRAERDQIQRDFERGEMEEDDFNSARSELQAAYMALDAERAPFRPRCAQPAPSPGRSSGA